MDRLIRVNPEVYTVLIDQPTAYAELLFDVLSTAYELTSLIITTQLAV